MKRMIPPWDMAADCGSQGDSLPRADRIASIMSRPVVHFPATLTTAFGNPQLVAFTQDCPPRKGSVVPRHSLTKTTAIAIGVAFLTLSSATGALADPAPSAPNLKINEIETDGTPDWAELINLDSTPLDISGYVLTGALNKFSVVVPENTVIPAGGVYLADGTDFPALKFKKGDTFTVFEADGT